GLAAARANRGARLAAMGVTALPPDRALEGLGRVLQDDHPQLAIVRLNTDRWLASVAAGPRSILAGLSAEEERMTVIARGADLRTQLLEAKPNARAAILTGQIKTRLARVLQLQIDQIREDTPFRSMGMDSLTSVELRNLLEATFEL